MTKVANIFTILCLTGFMFFTSACGETKTASESETTSTTTDETSTKPTEDKSKRPSPPAVATAAVGATNVTIDYSSPAAKGRTIWGDLVPYDQVWRTGANEATTFTVDKNVMINGQALAAGKYSLFTIPTQGEWTVIFNSVENLWGAYDYDATKDVLRVTASPRMLDESVDRLKFDIGADGKVTLTWDKLALDFTVAEAGN
ncbi:MAG: DUF2911 domain-containing protein [Bacteroidia bacterium]